VSVKTRLIAEGAAFSIHEILRNGRSYVEEFIKTLQEDTRDRLIRLIERLADKGMLRNDQKFRLEEEGIFAIKQGQVRVYCFFDAGRVIILTHGTIKKRQKADPEDLKRAKRLRDAYLAVKRH